MENLWIVTTRYVAHVPLYQLGDVDEHVRVIDEHLLRGLGYGLDDAALLTARRFRFTPATQCARPVQSAFVLAVRFERTQ